MNIKGIINKVSAEHPYKIPGDRASYSQYNEAWQDCIARKGVITMTEREKTKKAIYSLGFIKGILYNGIYADRLDCIDYAISALKEIQQYRKIGTVEACREAVKEEDAIKFYYCESEDDYYIGKRVGNFYYSRYGETGFEWFMSRYLPWGEHVIAPNTLWKEHIYPSEPKEIPFFEWLQGFIKRYCGGTVEECREAVEKQEPKKPEVYDSDFDYYKCPACGACICGTDNINDHNYCLNCGQAIDWEESEEE